MNFTCATPGCIRPVEGIYCDQHRSALQITREAMRAERSDRMKKMRQDPQFMAKLAAGRAPAKEEA